MMISGSRTAAGATPSEYHVRPAEAQDVGAILALLTREYGSYPYPLDPAKFRLGVFLVVEWRGQIIGFARATPIHGVDRAYILGGLIVSPEHRQYRLAERLTIPRLEGIRGLGAVMATSEPICPSDDCASQKNMRRHGFAPLGILFAQNPGVNAGKLEGQPETGVLVVKYLDPTTCFSSQRRVFLPRDYAELLRLLPSECLLSAQEGSGVRGPMPGNVWHQAYEADGVVGPTFIDIPLNWPGAPDVIAAHRRVGYRFSAFLPAFGRTTDGSVFDLIRLYRLPRTGADLWTFDRVHVLPELAWLKAWMARELAA